MGRCPTVGLHAGRATIHPAMLAPPIRLAPFQGFDGTAHRCSAPQARGRWMWQRRSYSARALHGDERDRRFWGQPFQLTASYRQGLLQSAHAREIDDAPAGDHEHVGRDDAVPVVNSHLFPKTAHLREAGLRGRSSNHSIAALNTDDTFAIDGAQRRTARTEYAPLAFLDLALENPHLIGRSGKP